MLDAVAYEIMKLQGWGRFFYLERNNENYKDGVVFSPGRSLQSFLSVI